MTKKNLGLGSETPRIWRYGSQLSRLDQAKALMAWEDRRYIVNGEPEWVVRSRAGGKDYPPQFASDLDWLEHTKFAVTMTGKLDQRCRECREEPTWPTRPDLVGASEGIQAVHAPNL